MSNLRIITKIGTWVAFFITSLICHSQIDSVSYLKSGGTRVGFFVDVTSTDLYGDKVNNNSTLSYQTKPALGWHVGAVIQNQLGKGWFTDHELGLKKSNTLLVNSTSALGDPFLATLSTLKFEVLPLSLGYEWRGLGVFIGPYTSALIEAYITEKDEQGKIHKNYRYFGNGKEDGETFNYFQKFDAGLATGIRYRTPFGFVFQVRYQRGFVPLFDDANAYTFGKENSKINIYNHTWTFGISYLIVK